VKTRLSRAALALASVLAAASAHAADKPCTPADKAKADKGIDNVVNWAQMQKAYVDFSHCDTGEIADLYTDALLRLIVEWKNVEAFSAAMQKDPQFKEFVYAHLKSPAAKDDRSAIFSRCSQGCPKGQEAFCAELAAVVNPPPVASPPK
jgi:hypothetical protein